MANQIYNSARYLFSRGVIDWAGNSVPVPEWAATTVYTAGQKVLDVTGHNVYVCKTGGTSGGSAPTWAVTGDITDGTAVWNFFSMSFESYTVKAALVNTSATGGSGMMVYTAPNNSSDAVVYTKGTSGGRNMYTEFGFGQASIANTSLIRYAGNTASDNITAELTGRTFVSATQAADSADITFTNVPDTGNWGTNIEALVLYVQNTASWAATDGSDCPVIAFIDTLATGAMAIDPNGGDIVVQWNASGIFRL